MKGWLIFKKIMLIKVVHASSFDIRLYSMHFTLVGLAKLVYDSKFVMLDFSGWTLVERGYLEGCIDEDSKHAVLDISAVLLTIKVDANLLLQQMSSLTGCRVNVADLLEWVAHFQKKHAYQGRPRIMF